MEIRAVKDSDFQDIINLVPTQEELFYVYPNGRHPFTIEQVRALAETRKELTVIVEDGKVIGFANLYNLDPPKSAYIGNIVVGRTARGVGYGRKLVSHMICKAFEKYAVDEVRIAVFNDNTPALLLYASMHFEPYALEERKGHSDNRVVLIHMRRGRNTKTV
jgi:ribosomal protein S18 acetylase RimI-like enzyme